ncbi:MAG: prolipoprotein diacylglyceryl transferase [Candidatus Levybacteria bacterium]|nr:prolipoprotein diacylglyceryl transferase [Candidatus Levybacteria bacterium]
MQFFIFFLVVCLFIFLFCEYYLAKDDLVFLRKNISMERFFNIIFIGSLFCLLGARFFYGLFHAKQILLNPFVFLLFPYFPGLSLVGGVIGAVVFYLILSLNKKNPLPLGRMSDFFSVGFLITLPVGFLGYFMFAEEMSSLIRTISLMAVYIILFAIFWKIFLPQMLNHKFKDGTITFLFLVCFSLVSIISNTVRDFKEILTLENVIFLIMLISSLVFLIMQENLLSKVFKIRKN